MYYIDTAGDCTRIVFYLYLIPLSYLLGSIPFAMIIARAHKIDLRSTGSGNIGATNLSRALGRNWGIFCFCLDVLKGVIPMLAASLLLPAEPSAVELSMSILTGLAAVTGHIFPVYIGFKGGKGVATSFGIALGLWQYYCLPAAIAIIIWTAALVIRRYISLASVIASASFPLSLCSIILLKETWTTDRLWPLMIVSAAIPAMVIIRHISNIRRIAAGTEPKVFN